MNSLYLRCALAGILFGAWPLLMNRSKLGGNVSAAVFALGAFLCVLPFALKGFNSAISNAAWVFAIAAAIVGGLGLIAFNSVLAEAKPQNIGSLFVLMLLLQIITPAIYDVIMNNGLSAKKAIGFLTALAAAALLA